METATRTSTRTTASPSRGVELAFLLPGGERLSSRPYPVTTFGDLRRSLWDEAHHDQEDEAEDEDDKDTKERRRRLAAALVNVAHVDRLKLYVRRPLFLGATNSDVCVPGLTPTPQTACTWDASEQTKRLSNVRTRRSLPCVAGELTPRSPSSLWSWRRDDGELACPHRASDRP